MKLVAIDTSTKALSVAAIEDGTLVAERWQFYERNHSVILMPLLSEMLDTLSWEAKDVDVFAAVTGPGSFTGVRIGVSTARALAHGVGKPAVGVDTLSTLAMNASVDDVYICPMLDARRDQVYSALYRMENGEPTELIPPSAVAATDMLELLPKNVRIFFAGDGAVKFRALIKDNIDGILLPSCLMMPRAAAAAQLAMIKYQRGEYCRYNELQPIYLRESQAEQALKKHLSARS